MGTLSNSIIRVCDEYKLDWSQGIFTILGLPFSTDVFNIWDINCPQITSKVENICSQWSKRKLTLLSQINKLGLHKSVVHIIL